MADLDPNRNDPAGRWSRHSKTLALWVLIVLMSVLAVNFVRDQENPAADFTYTEFRQQLDANNVHKVTVVEQRRVLGELRSPVARNGQDMVAFETTLPGELSADLEGMAVLSPNELLLVNDNDFGVEGATTCFWRLNFREPLLG